MRVSLETFLTQQSWPKNRAEHGHVETSQLFVWVSGTETRALLGCPV